MKLFTRTSPTRPIILRPLTLAALLAVAAAGAYVVGGERTQRHHEPPSARRMVRDSIQTGGPYNILMEHVE